MLTAFDSRDRRVARAHPPGKFGLGQPKSHTVLDHEPCNLLIGSEARLLLAVCGATADPPPSSFHDGSAECRVFASHFDFHLTKLGKGVNCSSWRVVANRPRLAARFGVHPRLKVVPPLLCQLDVGLRDL